MTATGTTYVEGDALGSTRQLTDSTGNIAGTQQYDAYGQTRAQTGTQLPFQFTGQETDAESGLQYLRGRYYDPATGRFLSEDPLAAAGGNAYPYAANNPVNATDPSGLAWQQDCLGCGSDPYQIQAASDATNVPVSNGPLSDCASGYATAGADGQWYCSDVNGNPVNPSGPTNPDGSCQSGYTTEVTGPDGLTTVCAYAPDTSSGPPEAGTQDWQATCAYGYGNNPNGAGCYCGPGQTPYQVGANPYCIPPPVDANGNPWYPANASCAHGWDMGAQACVCGPGDAPMSVVGPSGADCVEPAGATYSAGPYAVEEQSQAPAAGSGSGSGGHSVEVASCDALGHCTTITVDPPTAGPSGGASASTNVCDPGALPGAVCVTNPNPGSVFQCTVGGDYSVSCVPAPGKTSSGGLTGVGLLSCIASIVGIGGAAATFGQALVAAPGILKAADIAFTAVYLVVSGVSATICVTQIGA